MIWDGIIRFSSLEAAVEWCESQGVLRSEIDQQLNSAKHEFGEKYEYSSFGSIDLLKKEIDSYVSRRLVAFVESYQKGNLSGI